MEKNYQNIDKDIRKELINYQVSAPDDVWDNIELELNSVRKKKWLKVYRAAAAVAAITLIGSITIITLKNVNHNSLALQNEAISKNSETTVNKLEDYKEDKQAKVAELDEIEQQTKANLAHVENEKHSVINKKNSQQVVQHDYNQSYDGNNFTQINYADAIQKLAAKVIEIDVKKYEPEIIYTEKTNFNPYKDLIINPNNEYALAQSNKNKKNGKWSIGADFSPIYSYRHLTQASSATSEYYNQLESPVTSFTAGIDLQYKTNNRLSIQTGIYYLSMGQSLDYLSVYVNQAYSLVGDKYKDRYINNYQLENSAGNIKFSTPYVVVDERGTRVMNLSSNKSYFDTSDPIFQNLNAGIQQSFQYIEIPVMLKYKLIDKLIDFTIIGGVGVNYMVGNKVYLVQGNAREEIGETSDINALNFSGSLGVGIDYPLSNHLSLSLEPTVKYYLNSINTNFDYKSHPYALGIYTGISYSF